MKHEARSMNDEAGFSLAELLVVMAIMAILATIGFSSYAGFKNKQSVEAEVAKLTATVREAMELSRSQADSGPWGVHIANPAGAENDFYEIWRGDLYVSGTVTSRLNLSATNGFTDPADGAAKDVIFARATGLPTASTTIVIHSSSGGGTGTINIDTSGRVDYTLN